MTKTRKYKNVLGNVNMNGASGAAQPLSKQKELKETPLKSDVSQEQAPPGFVSVTKCRKDKMATMEKLKVSPELSTVAVALPSSSSMQDILVRQVVHTTAEPSIPYAISAGRDFQKGEIILASEKPLLEVPVVQNIKVTGTFYTDENVIICISCYKIIAPSTADVLQECTKCGFVVCDETCSDRLSHSWECKLITKYPWKIELKTINSAPKMAAFFMTLRLWEAKTGNPEHWTNVMKCSRLSGKSTGLEDFLEYYSGVIEQGAMLIHSDIGGDLKVILSETETAVKDVYSMLMHRSLYFNPEMIRYATGSIFEIGSYLKHSCLPNCLAAVNETNGHLKIIAAVDIKKGEELTTCRIHTDEVSIGLQALQLRLHDAPPLPLECIPCLCNSCGSNGNAQFINTIKCTDVTCNGSFLIPKSLMNHTNLETQEGYWQCRQKGCNRLITGNKILEMYRSLEDKYQTLYTRMESSDWSAIEELSEFVTTLKSTVHPCHYLLIKSLNLYSLFPNILFRMSDACLTQAHRHQKQLTEILDNLIPGLNVYKAIAAFQRHRILELMVLRRVAKGNASDVSKFTETRLVWKEMKEELAEVGKHIEWRNVGMQRIDVLTPVFDALKRHSTKSSDIEFHTCISPSDIMANVQGVNYDPAIHLPPVSEPPEFVAFHIAQDCQFADYKDLDFVKNVKEFLQLMA